MYKDILEICHRKNVEGIWDEKALTKKKTGMTKYSAVFWEPDLLLVYSQIFWRKYYRVVECVIIETREF